MSCSSSSCFLASVSASFSCHDLHKQTNKLLGPANGTTLVPLIDVHCSLHAHLLASAMSFSDSFSCSLRSLSSARLLPGLAPSPSSCLKWSISCRRSRIIRAFGSSLIRATFTMVLACWAYLNGNEYDCLNFEGCVPVAFSACFYSKTRHRTEGLWGELLKSIRKFSAKTKVKCNQLYCKKHIKTSVEINPKIAKKSIQLV